MFVVDKVVEEVRRLLIASELESITLPDGTSRSPSSRTLTCCETASVPCFCGSNISTRRFSKNYNELFRKARVSSRPFHTSRPYIAVIFTASGTLTRVTMPPFLAASQSAFRTPRGTCVIFPLLKQPSAELATEAEVALILLIELASGEAEAGEIRPGWMRVLAMEIMRGCVFLSLSLILRCL